MNHTNFCVNSLFSLIDDRVWLLLCSLSPSCGWILHDSQHPLSPLRFCFCNYDLLLCFWIFSLRHWSYLPVLFVQSFLLFSPLVCASFIPPCPSSIPSSHLQPGSIRDLVSWVMCPPGAFLSLRYLVCVHECASSEHFLCPGRLT